MRLAIYLMAFGSVLPAQPATPRPPLPEGHDISSRPPAETIVISRFPDKSPMTVAKHNYAARGATAAACTAIQCSVTIINYYAPDRPQRAFELIETIFPADIQAAERFISYDQQGVRVAAMSNVYDDDTSEEYTYYLDGTEMATVPEVEQRIVRDIVGYMRGSYCEEFTRPRVPLLRRAAMEAYGKIPDHFREHFPPEPEPPPQPVRQPARPHRAQPKPAMWQTPFARNAKEFIVFVGFVALLVLSRVHGPKLGSSNPEPAEDQGSAWDTWYILGDTWPLRVFSILMIGFMVCVPIVGGCCQVRGTAQGILAAIQVPIFVPIAWYLLNLTFRHGRGIWKHDDADERPTRPGQILHLLGQEMVTRSRHYPTRIAGVLLCVILAIFIAVTTLWPIILFSVAWRLTDYTMPLDWIFLP